MENQTQAASVDSVSIASAPEQTNDLAATVEDVAAEDVPGGSAAGVGKGPVPLDRAGQRRPSRVHVRNLCEQIYYLTPPQYREHLPMGQPPGEVRTLRTAQQYIQSLEGELDRHVVDRGWWRERADWLEANLEDHVMVLEQVGRRWKTMMPWTIPSAIVPQGYGWLDRALVAEILQLFRESVNEGRRPRGRGTLQDARAERARELVGHQGHVVGHREAVGEGEPGQAASEVEGQHEPVRDGEQAQLPGNFDLLQALGRTIELAQPPAGFEEGSELGADDEPFQLLSENEECQEPGDLDLSKFRDDPDEEEMFGAQPRSLLSRPRAPVPSDDMQLSDSAISRAQVRDLDNFSSTRRNQLAASPNGSNPVAQVRALSPVRLEAARTPTDFSEKPLVSRELGSIKEDSQVLDRDRILTGLEKEEHERRWRQQIQDMPHLTASNKATIIGNVEVFRNAGTILPLHSEGGELAAGCLKGLACNVMKGKKLHEPSRATCDCCGRRDGSSCRIYEHWGGDTAAEMKSLAGKEIRKRS